MPLGVKLAYTNNLRVAIKTQMILVILFEDAFKELRIIIETLAV